MSRRMSLFFPAMAMTICLAGCLLLNLQGRSQSQLAFRTPGNDSMKVVLVLNADTYRGEQVDSATSLTTLTGNVRLKQGNTLINCDSMVSNSKDNSIQSFGHVHIIDNDSTNITSDYMKYQVDTRNILFQKNVKMTDGKGVLTTEELTYDLNLKMGIYDHGGKVVNNGSVLTSDAATYYEDTKDVHFRKNVVLRDPQYDLTADSLLYNTQTQISTFITETFILFKDSTRRTVRTRDGYYDLKNKKAEFGKRPVITDGSQSIVGDSVRFDDSTGISTAIGRAVYKDTAQGFSMIANYMISDKKQNTFLATQNPLLILKQDKDSIYITADTFFSARLVDAEAIFRRNFINDSMHRIFVDSLFRRSADSLHQAATDKGFHGRDTTQEVGGNGKGQIITKDQSHPLHAADSLHRHLKDSVDLNENPALSDSLALADSLALSDSLDLSDSLNLNGHKRSPALDSLLARKRAGGPDSLKAAFGQKAKPVIVIDSSFKHMAFPDSILVNRPVKNRPVVPVPGLNPVTKYHPYVAPPYNPRLDSLLRKKKEPIDSSIRFIQGYHHVRIFSDSLQAVADSLFYSGKDSIFRLYKEPIAWSNNNFQVTGDTMFVYTKNKKASRMYVFENGLAINKVGANFYNQIKGTTINCYFKDGEIDYLRAKGNAESIYYVQDDNKAYTGVNKAHADIIDMIFDKKEKEKGRELKKVVLRNDAEGSMIPFKKVNFDDMRLRGFKWQEAKRPKTKFELFENKPIENKPTVQPKDSPGDSTRKMIERVIEPMIGPANKGILPSKKQIDSAKKVLAPAVLKGLGPAKTDSVKKIIDSAKRVLPSPADKPKS
ncbi:OstA-like protein [Flavitalea flava]